MHGHEDGKDAYTRLVLVISDQITLNILSWIDVVQNDLDDFIMTKDEGTSVRAIDRRVCGIGSS